MNWTQDCTEKHFNNLDLGLGTITMTERTWESIKGVCYEAHYVPAEGEELQLKDILYGQWSSGKIALEELLSNIEEFMEGLKEARKVIRKELRKGETK